MTYSRVVSVLFDIRVNKPPRFPTPLGFIRSVPSIVAAGVLLTVGAFDQPVYRSIVNVAIKLFPWLGILPVFLCVLDS